MPIVADHRTGQKKLVCGKDGKTIPENSFSCGGCGTNAPELQSAIDENARRSNARERKGEKNTLISAEEAHAKALGRPLPKNT